MQTIIHINRNIIQSNAKRGESIPPCRVQKGTVVRYCMEVVIHGPSRMVYRPTEPLKCGAKLWIETDSDVELINEET